MKYAYAFAALTGLVAARDIPLYVKEGVQRREVPQEHSHDPIVIATNKALQLNNPLKIQDAVFALLGNKAAAAGAPNVANLDCLQQIVADQAFTNAKAAGDVNSQAQAILFRALERNTGSVGLASVSCNETATNPEIAAIQQHQDPASPQASGNKDIALNVAKQLASIGADPNLAIQSGTFKPGKIGDPTAKGNTCDVAGDPKGCIISQNLLNPDVTEADIKAAVAGVAVSASNSTAAAAASNSTVAAVSAADNSTAVAGAGNSTAAAAAGKGKGKGKDAKGKNKKNGKGKGKADKKKGKANNANANANANANNNANANANANANSAAAEQLAAEQELASLILARATNVQTFKGTLGGPAPPVQSTAGSNRPFSVDGSTFVNIGAALQRSCSVQHNACANAANQKKVAGGVAACQTQETQCNAAGGKKMRRMGIRAAAFGGCTDPSIKFSSNNADRKGEAAFAPSDLNQFSHGSAQKIGIISNFICGQLGSKCKAGAATVSKCNAASGAASKLTGQAAADAFNKALGV